MSKYLFFETSTNSNTNENKTDNGKNRKDQPSSSSTNYLPAVTADDVPLTTTQDIYRNVEILQIKSEKEYKALQQKQTELFDDAKNEKISLQKRQDELYKIQLDLRKKFLETNDFLRQCERKKIEAERQIESELKSQEEIKNEIEKYTEDIKKLEEFKKVLGETVEEFAPYETVMEEVIKGIDYVKTTKECMDRCDALMLTQDEITELEKSKIKAIEKMKNKMVKTINEASLTILGLNNELAQLEHLYDSAKNECMKWENILAKTQNLIISNEMKTSICIDAIRQMYHLICKRNGWDEAIGRNNIEKQLDTIKDEIEILQKVINLCEKGTKMN